jgi:hypothetical protein
MKIILMVLVFISQAAAAQLTTVAFKETQIGRAKRAGGEFAWLKMHVIGQDTTYQLSFRNAKYTSITDIQSVTFKGAQTVDDLYATLAAALVKNKGERTTFVLGESSVFVDTDKQMGMKMIYLYAGNGRFWMNENNLKQLFGRK